MANEYKYQGSDLASRFATRSSAKRADVGYKINGVDVSNYWEKTSGGDQINYDTGFKSGGVDFRYLFRSSGYTPPTPTPAPTATPTPTPTPAGPTATPTPTPTPACSKYGVFNDGGVLDFWYYDCNGNYQNAVDIYYVEVCNGDAYNIGCSWPGTYNVCNYMGSCP